MISASHFRNHGLLSETFIHTPSFDAFVFPHRNQKSIFFLASNLSTYFLPISIHTLSPFFLCSIYQTGNSVSFSLDNFLTWKTAAANSSDRYLENILGSVLFLILRVSYIYTTNISPFDKQSFFQWLLGRRPLGVQAK